MKEAMDSVSVVLGNEKASEVSEMILQKVNQGLVSVGASQDWADKVDNLVVLLLIIGVALLANVICRYIILHVVPKFVRKTKTAWNNIVFDRKVLVHISRMAAPVIIYLSIPIAYPEHADSEILDFLRRLCLIYVLGAFLKFISVFMDAVYQIYSNKEQFRDKPLKGILQTAQIILYCIGAIVIISILIKQSPTVLLTGLGASAAVLMLVFKDTIMGFVSGIQLSANNMLKVGDLISMPKYGVDGTVIEVGLNTVKVRNLDNTIITIPPYLLVSDSFQNWEGIRSSEGRRVKRSINIDMNSVRFCTQGMLAKYRRIHLLKEYIDATETAVEEYNKEHRIDNSVNVNGRHQTNLGVFRAYLVNYLRSLPGVNQELTCMVRQLQPTESGIPMELYFFSANKDLIPYEKLQADVFDHVLAIIPEFGLRVFQNPTGEDFQSLKTGN